MSDIKDYNEDIQRLFLQFLISDHDLFARCQNILRADYFNNKFKPTIDLMVNHSKDYNAVPTIEQINAVGGAGIDVIDNVTPEHQSWFMDEFETFCRHKALEKAIIEAGHSDFFNGVFISIGGGVHEAQTVMVRSVTPDASSFGK